MCAVEGTTWDHLIQSPFFKLSHQEHISLDHIETGLEHLQRRSLYSLSGQHIPVLCHPHSEDFLMRRWNCLCSSLTLLPFVLLLGTTANHRAPSH